MSDFTINVLCPSGLFFHVGWANTLDEAKKTVPGSVRQTGTEEWVSAQMRDGRVYIIADQAATRRRMARTLNDRTPPNDPQPDQRPDQQ